MKYERTKVTAFRTLVIYFSFEMAEQLIGQEKHNTDPVIIAAITVQ